MPETVTVTIRYEGKEQDYSLPLTEPVERWISALGEALGAGSSVVLSQEGKELNQSCSLAFFHIWDGAVLTAARR